MTLTTLLLALFGLAAVGWFTGRARAYAFAGAGEPGAVRVRPHSLPTYHGWHLAAFVLLPALVFLAVWAAVQPSLVEDRALQAPAAASLPGSGFARQVTIDEAAALAGNPDARVFNSSARTLAPAFAEAQAHYRWIAVAVALLLAFAGGAYGWTRVRPDFRARTRIERLVMGVLLAASLIAILTTLGIVASLLFESLRFFARVNPIDFLFGTNWSPQSIDPADPGRTLGSVPLFWGTIFIGAIIAMAVAIPLGLMSAVYLTQYAAPRARRWLKPTLEVLAGVPTVVYGYFAALTVAPFLRDMAVAVGVPNASSESALAAGLVMGVMIIPFVSSMADDSIAAVPGAMRDGSLAMGATPSETIKRVLIPAALPGVVGGVLLAVSRAIGETMIVVMAAGLAANLTANPFASVTTVTTQIVQLLTGDQEFDSPKTLAAFALGLALFVVTLLLNIVALRVVKRFREAYE